MKTRFQQDDFMLLSVVFLLLYVVSLRAFLFEEVDIQSLRTQSIKAHESRTVGDYYRFCD